MGGQTHLARGVDDEREPVEAVQDDGVLGAELVGREAQGRPLQHLGGAAQVGGGTQVGAERHALDTQQGEGGG